jgi:hypothetical protein
LAGKELNQSGLSHSRCPLPLPKNPHTEYITFDVVDMPYPYNTIFGRGLLNTFEAALHLAYLCLKVPATFRVISIFYSQQEAKNIEKDFALGHKMYTFCGSSMKPNLR